MKRCSTSKKAKYMVCVRNRVSFEKISCYYYTSIFNAVIDYVNLVWQYRKDNKEIEVLMRTLYRVG